jgi:ATP-dependent phosphofructokinase / diphosphate-dependent phosphofructokinase
MKRLGVLTAGGDTPALNATIHGAVVRANQLRIEVFGFIKGFNSLFNPRVPHLHLNPLFQSIPELDPTIGGTLLAASRDYVDPDDGATIRVVYERLHQLKIDGLICIGGDGTLNAMQPLAECLPVVLAPKTIDNDLGLNYRGEPDDWQRESTPDGSGYRYSRQTPRSSFDLDQMINFVTPGYATAVFVTAAGIQRVRTTAESHRRIAIVEVMGRHSGFIALGSAYGQPDIVLVPESPINLDRIVDRILQLYDLQKNVVIVCGEGIVNEDGRELGAEQKSTDPAGNTVLGGAANVLRQQLAERIGNQYFKDRRRGSTAAEAIFTRKVGHTQRGGRPLMFDRFHAAQLGGKAVDLLVTGHNNCVSTLQWTRDRGFQVDHFEGNGFRDRWGRVHARQLHPSFYDRNDMMPSRVGIEYLTQIFTNAIGRDDVESVRETLFAPGNLLNRYHSINTEISKRIRYLVA